MSGWKNVLQTAIGRFNRDQATLTDVCMPKAENLEVFEREERNGGDDGARTRDSNT